MAIPQNELLNVLTHALGFVVFIPIHIILLKSLWSNKRYFWWVLPFIASTFLLLASSVLHHWTVENAELNGAFLRLDHVAIFLLIASTFSAIHGILFKGFWRDTFMKIFWGMSLFLAFISSIFLSIIPENFWYFLYVGIGWMGLISAVEIIRVRGIREIGLVILGGILYTVGAYFGVAYDLHWVFHIYVIFGMLVHWAYIRQLVLRAGTQIYA